MKRMLVVVIALLAGMVSVTMEPAFSEEVHCMAYSPECGFPEGTSPVYVTDQSVPPLPHKCWKKSYRKDHKKKCRDYGYWKTQVGVAR